MGGNTKPQKEKPPEPKPSTSPPGRLLSFHQHGLSEPPAIAAAPIDRLRAALGLSAEVPADRVIAEAADRLQPAE